MERKICGSTNARDLMTFGESLNLVNGIDPIFIYYMGSLDRSWFVGEDPILGAYAKKLW